MPGKSQEDPTEEGQINQSVKLLPNEIPPPYRDEQSSSFCSKLPIFGTGEERVDYNQDYGDRSEAG